MRIAVMGAGKVGAALGGGWLRRGHAVTYGVRDPVTADPDGRLRATGAAVADAVKAAADAEVIVFCVPWTAAEPLARQLGRLAGRTVIDCMNPLAMTETGLALSIGHSTSGAETLAGWLPDAHVVKTLNQVGAEVMADTTGFAAAPVMFVAGDHAPAKAQAMALVADLGFEALDAGDLSKARLLEPLAMVWINQALLRGLGRNWAFSALRRD